MVTDEQMLHGYGLMLPAQRDAHFHLLAHERLRHAVVVAVEFDVVVDI